VVIEAPAPLRALIVLGSYRSKRYVYERARELGYELFVLDGRDHWTAAASGPGELFAGFAPIDLTPRGALVADAGAAARSFGVSFDLATTIDEFATPLAAGVARALGLFAHDLEAVTTVRNKSLVRHACLRAGIPTPRFARVRGEGDLELAMETVGFPGVLKPGSGVGSVQAFPIRDRGSLVEAFRRLRRETEGAGPGALSRSDKHWFDLMWSGGFDLVYEEFLNGPKVDIDLVISQGALVYAGVIDDETPAHLRDAARRAPSSIDPVAQTALVDHAWRSVLAAGLRDGVFNVEVKWTERGPRLVEINGRLGGYGTWDVHREVWGVDLIDLAFRTARGPLPRNPEWPLRPRPRCCVAESLLPSTQTGVLAEDGFLDALRNEPDVVTARPWMFAGDAVLGLDEGVPDWLGNVIVRGGTPDEAHERLRALAPLVVPSIRRGGG
jgi:carnosine synthase